MKRILSVLLCLCLLIGSMSMIGVLAANYSGTPTVSDFSGTSAGFYFDSTDGVPQPNDGTGGWLTNFFGVDNAAGVFLNGTKTTVPIRKVSVNSWYVCLDNTLALTAGDILTVKGAFDQAANGTNRVTLQETHFVYDGTNFSDYYHYTGAPYMHHNDSNAGFYFTAGDAAPIDQSWATQWHAVAGKGSVTKNGAAISIDIRKVEPVDSQWYVVLSDYGVVPAVGDVFAISGTFNNARTNERIRFETMSATWTGSEFRVNYSGAPQYKRDDANGNGVYFSAGDTAPVTGWSSNWDKVSGGIYKNGVETNVAVRKVDNDEWYVLLADFGQTAVAGDVITVNGTFKYLNNYVTFSQKDFVFNGSAWAEKAPVAVGTESSFHSSNGALGAYILSNDGLTAPGWNYFFYAADDDSGVFVNDTKYAGVHLQKTESNVWYVALDCTGLTFAKGDKAVIKGLFAAELDANKKASIAELTLAFNGSEWETYVPDTTCYGTSTTFDSSSGAAGIQISSDDGLTAPGWGTYFYAADGDENGFFINGTKYNVHLQKHTDTLWYVDVGFSGASVTKGDVAVLKGLFAAEQNADKKVSFAEITLYYNGNAWSDQPEIIYYGTGTTFDSSSGAAGLQIASDDGMPAPGWGTYFYAVDGDENGFFINGTKHSVHLQKHTDTLWYVDVGFSGVSVTKGDVAVLKGLFAAEQNANTKVSFAEIKLQYNGSAWTLYKPVTTYTGTTSAFYAPNAESGVYITSDDGLTAPGWNNFFYAADDESGVFVNGTKYAAVHLQKTEGDIWYADLSCTGLTYVRKDSIVIKGSFVPENDSSIIVSLAEISLNYTGVTWTDAPVIDPVYTTVNVESYIENVSGYRESVGKWYFYLYTKEALPGASDQVFLYITVTDEAGNSHEVPCYHAGGTNDLFIEVGTDILAADGTAKLTFGGKAVSEDGTIGMDVQPFSLYVNPYGASMEGFIKPVVIEQENAVLKPDTETFGWTAGNANGIYLLTDDRFTPDTDWTTSIVALPTDKHAGVYVNGEKIPAVLKKYQDGKLYVALIDGGVTAKDGDKVTIKGAFHAAGQAISYKEVSFYYNGQSWHTSYREQTPLNVQKITIKGIDLRTSYNFSMERWDVFLQVNGTLPGVIDKMNMHTLTLVINGKELAVPVYHTIEHLLYLAIPGDALPSDAAIGTPITLKAGTAMNFDGINGVELTKDFAMYSYYTSLSADKPTTKTSYKDITVPGLLRTMEFHAPGDIWQFYLKVDGGLELPDNTQFYGITAKVDGKELKTAAIRVSSGYLHVVIPAAELPSNTKQAVFTIAAGQKGSANAGKTGIRLANDVTCYLFNGVWSDLQFTEINNTELRSKMVETQNYDSVNKKWDMFITTTREVPGSEWFEYYEDFVYYYNGKKVDSYACKSGSINGRMYYFPIEEAAVGAAKEGDILLIKAGTVATCGGYQFTQQVDFGLIFTNGKWVQYLETDVQAPAAADSVWSEFRFDPAYIPLLEKDGVLYSPTDTYNKLTSLEKRKDVSITFKTTKMLMNEETPTTHVILRGNPINDDNPMSETLLYGYVITFGYVEVTQANKPNDPELWGTKSQFISIWKNGINEMLEEQYRIGYQWDLTDHPYFEYGVEHEYTFSVFNISEDVCCIEVYVDGKLAIRTYDHGTSDELDPVYNAGECAIFATCPNYIDAPMVELGTVIASSAACEVGDKVRVSATYPSVLEGVSYTVAEEGATISNGVFTAQKPGTYTVTAVYNGKTLQPVTITVTEKAVAPADDAAEFPWLYVGIGGGAFLLIAAVVFTLIALKRKKAAKTA